jgi:hypothetical protein
MTSTIFSSNLAAVRSNRIKLNGYWIGLTLLVVLAAIPRLATFSYSLPFIDHIDEPAYYLGALEFRGLYDSGGYYLGVPPGYLYAYTLGEIVLAQFNVTAYGDVVRFFRFLSVVANLITLVLIADSARRAIQGYAGSIAGLSAAMMWALAPLVIENSVYALPDPLIYLFTAAALWSAIVATSSERHIVRYTLTSTAAALIAIIIKYPAVPALIPGLLVTLWYMTKNKQQGIRLLIIQSALIATVAAWLIWGYGITFQREGAIVQSSGLSNMLNIGRIATNLGWVFIPLNAAFCAVALMLGIAVFAFARRRVNGWVVLLCLSLIVTIPWLTASYSEVYFVKVRYVLPATLAACILCGVVIAQVIAAVSHRYTKISGLIMIAVLTVTVWLPQANTVSDLVRDRQRPDSRFVLHQWFDENLEPGNVLLPPNAATTFNPYWGGLSLSHGRWIDWLVVTDIRQYPVSEWLSRGFRYAVIPYEQKVEWEANADARAYLESMLHLRDFSSDTLRGPHLSVYRLARMTREVEVAFSDYIRLVGYDVDQVNEMRYRFYWRADAIPMSNYSLFLHLVDQNTGEVIAQVDGALASPDRPTLTWDTSDETLISGEYQLSLPTDIPAGQYEIRLGLYDYLTGVRLTTDGGDYHVLAIP